MTNGRIRVGILGAGAMAAAHAAAYAEIGDIDAIDVCLPTPVHHRFVRAALVEEKHVFCETPLALRLDEARQMRDAARSAGRLLQVGLLMRSVAPYEYVKAASVSGEHGRVLSLALQRFAGCIRGRADPALLDVDRAIEALTLSIATQRSLETARAVAIRGVR